jgi:hypothetical protein
MRSAPSQVGGEDRLSIERPPGDYQRAEASADLGIV